jgi:hypothetical protein
VRFRARASVIALLTLLPAIAGAQTETKTAVADALYRQARDLMAAGDYARACPKFAESQRLDPATGTLLNLAACHEKQGRLATAWLEYSDAVFAARRDGREDRVAYAEERARALEPKLSRLTLLLAADADEPNLEIELDGASVGRAVIGAPTPVDPGSHTVRATAPGKKAWSQTLQLEGEAAQQSHAFPSSKPHWPDPSRRGSQRARPRRLLQSAAASSRRAMSSPAARSRSRSMFPADSR